MDFTVFNKTEIEEMFETMFHNMPENIIQKAIEEFGSIEKWKNIIYKQCLQKICRSVM